MERYPAGEANDAEAGEQDNFVPLPLATDLSPGTVVGEYTIEGKLGDGGMATVYGATHPLIGKKAAIKVMAPALSLDAGLVERFILEARAVNEIGHPNIVDVFSFGQLSDGRSYFVMEWLQGETLYARLWERRLTLDEALDIIDQMCDALEAAHEKGIVHRDLKPANVFLCPVRGRRELVKLLDFGVAKLTRPVDDAPGGMVAPQTMSGQVVGTPEYIAPEQARGKLVDGKCDVYALGVMAYEMILGQRPFEADNSADLVRQHLTDAPPPPRTLWPEIPSLLEELMLRMLAKKADERPLPSDVRAVIHELRGTPPPLDFGEPAPVTAPPHPSPLLRPPPQRRKTGRRALGVALIGCGAALAATLGWQAQRRASSTRAPAATVSAPAPGTSPAASAGAATVNAASASAGAASANAAAPTANAASATANAAAGDGTLVVRVDAADARIELDGRMVAEAASGARVTAGAGEHALAVTAPGRKPYAARVTVEAGGVVELAVHLHGKGAARPAKDGKDKDKRVDPDYLVDPFSGAR